MRDRYHTAILLVSHDFSVVSALADRVLVLREGRMVEITEAGGRCCCAPGGVYETDAGSSAGWAVSRKM